MNTKYRHIILSACCHPQEQSLSKLSLCSKAIS
nr:MAG TPA: hypothetical protein [Caudoviricetes sp.]